MIEHRNSGFVTTNGLVPVNTICDKIGKGKTMDTLLRMFPKLNSEDVFEAIHFYADNVDVPHADTDKLLALVNVGSKAEETIIEVMNLHQVVYIKLVALGHELYGATTNDFASLMNQGLRIACLENVESMEEEKNLKSDVHGLVQEALSSAVPDVLGDTQRTKDDLDYGEFVQRRDNSNNGS
tara:strand:+ start:594 stop:1139 length:546 start_codon:yes stop_codon:yes gene_type:complete